MMRYGKASLPMDLMTYCDDAIGLDNIDDIGRVLDEYKN